MEPNPADPPSARSGRAARSSRLDQVPAPAPISDLPRRFAGAATRRVLNVEVPVADGRWSRLLGLTLLRREDAGPGLWIPRCGSVHTYGMRFPLDLYFFGEGERILEVRREVPPGRVILCRGATSVLELLD